MSYWEKTTPSTFMDVYTLRSSKDLSMKTFEPFEPFSQPAQPDTLALHIRTNLLRETLPYLQLIEGGTRTSPILRGLISDIAHLTKGK